MGWVILTIFLCSASIIGTYLIMDNRMFNRYIDDMNKYMELSLSKSKCERKYKRIQERLSEKIEVANKERTPIRKINYGEDLGYWNGAYQQLKELKEDIEEIMK